ncbi:MAG: hypothetical protein LUH40_00945, partial [Clostridiales bacterium]|nr:hypothetical protein [Clostridiales bacterium]
FSSCCCCSGFFSGGCFCVFGFSGGGFSGGGRPGGPGGPRGGGFGGPGGGYRPPPPPRRRRYWGRRYYGGGGCGSGIIVTIAVIVLAVLLMVASLFSAIGVSDNDDGLTNTTERTALSGQVNKTDWYEDQIGWVSSKSVMISGLEDFYNETGVQPYVLLVSYSEDYWNEDGTLNADSADEYLETVYSDTFTDEAHFIFAYFQCENDSRSEMDGEFRYLSGYSADTVMDSEAISILWGYFEINYYDTSLSMEKMISNTFSSTAELIMSSPTNGWDAAKVAIIVVGVIAVAVCVVILVKNIHKRNKEKAEENEKILNTPLNTFGNDTSDLEDKYK